MRAPSMNNWLLHLLLGGVLAVLPACHQERDPLPLVRVGEVTLDEGDLAEFGAKLPEHLDSQHRGEAAARDLLQTMVDRELLLLESRARGYAELPEVQRRHNGIRSRWLIRRLMEREAGDRLCATEEETREYFVEHDLGRLVFVSEIVVKTEDRALEIIDQLEAGASFAELARDESIARSADLGGEIRRYLGYGDMVAEVRGVLWGVGEGEHTREPIRLARGFGVYKILGVRHRPFEDVAPTLAKALGRRKVAAERRRLVEAWGERLGLKYHGAGIAALLSTSGDSIEVPAAVKRSPLATYEGGVVLVEEGILALTRDGRLLPQFNDSAAVAAGLRRVVVSDSILVQAARVLGLDREPEYLELAEKKREELLVKELWRQEARYKVEVADDEVRQVYEDSIHKYLVQGSTEIIEILTEEREDAEQLLARISAGEDMSDLARQHTARAGARGTGGRLHVHRQDEHLAAIYERAGEAVPGELVGPFEVAGGYSIFRLVAKEGATPKPFDRAAAVIRLGIRKKRENELFEAFVAGLRERYGEHVTWLDDNIAEAARALQ